MKSYRTPHQMLLPEEISRRLERNTGWLQRNRARLRKVLTRREITGTGHPVIKIARVAVAKLLAQLSNEIAVRFAGNAAPTSDDLATRKLRTLHSHVDKKSPNDGTPPSRRGSAAWDQNGR